MPRPRLALLDASHTVTMTRRNFRRELDADLDVFHGPSGDVPPHFDYDGVVITGSSASVYWDRDWIERLQTWVEGAVRLGLPALGVCYGHQLLATVTGGQVDDMGETEIGYRTVHHDGTNALLSGVPPSMTVFTTHSDHVCTPPPGATVFAHNDYGVQGFQKDRVFGVQFHPEYDLQSARRITRGKDKLSDERLQAVLDGIHDQNYAEAQRAKQLFDNFLHVVTETQSAPVAVH